MMQKQFDDLDIYIKYKISLMSAMLAPSNRLTFREFEFMVGIVRYALDGGDLSDVASVKKYMIENGYVSSDNEYYVTKTRLSKKGWMRKSRNKVDIPSILSDYDDFCVCIKYNGSGDETEAGKGV